MSETIPNTGKLLFDESPLIVQQTLAKKLGVDGALFVQQVHYLIFNKQKGSDFNTVKEGYVWVYNTWWGWQEFFPFWNQKKIQRLTDGLEKEGVLIVRKDFNQREYDQTKWYRIDYDKLMSMKENDYFAKEGSKEKAKKLARIEANLKAVGQNVQMVDSKGSKGAENEKEPSKPHEQPIGQNVQVQKDKMSKPIPKTSLTNTSLFSKYVGNATLELYSSLFKLTKYAEIELTKLIQVAGEILVSEAIQRAAKAEADKPIAYVKGTVSKWQAANCQTVEDIERYESDFRKKQAEQKQKARKPCQNSNKQGQPVRKEIVTDEVKQQLEEQRRLEQEEAEKRQQRSQEELEAQRQRLMIELEKYQR